MPCLSSIMGFFILREKFNVTVRIGPLRLSRIFFVYLLSVVSSVWPVLVFILIARDLRRNLFILCRVCTTFDDVIFMSKVPSCKLAIYWVLRGQLFLSLILHQFFFFVCSTCYIFSSIRSFQRANEKLIFV